MSNNSLALLRYALCVLFVWFAVQQLTDPSAWVSYLPAWTGYIPAKAEVFIRFNGWFELVFAGLLGLGLFTRFTAVILGLHLFGIAWTAGGAIGVRDAVLATCCLVAALSPADAWTLDQYFARKSHTNT